MRYVVNTDWVSWLYSSYPEKYVEFLNTVNKIGEFDTNNTILVTNESYKWLLTHEWPEVP